MDMTYEEYEEFYLSTAITDQGLSLPWLFYSTVDALTILE